jgi:allophanate hydrolase
MVNLLDLCAVVLPLATRSDGLPFGVQLVAPAFADMPLLELSALLLGEPGADPGPVIGSDRSLLAVCGAHMAGQPLNPVLVEAGGRLHARERTAAGYRMVRIDGGTPRPGLIGGSGGPAGGLEVELWDVPLDLVQQLAIDVEAPLRIETVRLADGSSAPGFTADPERVRNAPDISASGGWLAHLQPSGMAETSGDD